MTELRTEVHELFHQFMTDDLESPEALRAGVAAHAAQGRALGARSGSVDLWLIGHLERSCARLLDAWPGLSDDDRHLVQAAVRYFVWQEDEEDDFSSVVGLDDDLEVVEHVAGRLGISLE
ncbi:MAG: hypothetical protein KC656_19200 [Myxococcales bacterium]|nr:hypothetical protein [Myxococcales bacterium]MCB9669796.1 hypothetical protein [Alphaproteobacteria bacterium]